jgi:hypothetical protein
MGHPPLPPKLGVRESVEEVRLRSNRQVKVNGMVLAELERLETVEDESFLNRTPGAVEFLKEQAMPAKPLDLARNGGGRNPKLTSDLAVGGAGEGAVKEEPKQVGAAEPVGGMEGL